MTVVAHRNADDVERLLRANAAQNVHLHFITDNNSARNRNEARAPARPIGVPATVFRPRCDGSAQPGNRITIAARGP